MNTIFALFMCFNASGQCQLNENFGSSFPTLATCEHYKAMLEPTKAYKDDLASKGLKFNAKFVCMSLTTPAWQAVR